MQLYLTVRPEDTRTASAYPAGLAHAAYRIGEGSSLLSRNLLTPARSGQMAPLPGLLVLSDRSAPSIDRPAALAEAESSSTFPRPTPGRRSIPSLL